LLDRLPGLLFLEGGMLDKAQIEAIIPHRDPFLFLDRVLELVPGERVVAEKTLTGEEDFFRGHFPGYPVFPGVLQVEALAQAGAVAALCTSDATGKLALFGGLEKVRFRQQVRPGDTLRLEVTLVRSRGFVGKGEGRATVDGRLACSAQLTFALVDAL
jgi:3-hydroxyacyl-[acyl-carrier-protein] dehydratase